MEFRVGGREAAPRRRGASGGTGGRAAPGERGLSAGGCERRREDAEEEPGEWRRKPGRGERAVRGAHGAGARTLPARPAGARAALAAAAGAEPDRRAPGRVRRAPSQVRPTGRPGSTSAAALGGGALAGGGRGR